MFLQIVTFPQITLQKSYEVLGYVKQGGSISLWAWGTRTTTLVPLLRNNRIPSGPRCCSLLLKVGFVDHTEAAPTPAHHPLDACYYSVVSCG
jgi:hypothetical protein